MRYSLLTEMGYGEFIDKCLQKAHDDDYQPPEFLEDLAFCTASTITYIHHEIKKAPDSECERLLEYFYKLTSAYATAMLEERRNAKN
jgi:hypothetical protein